MAKPKIVTIMTDYGTRDGYVASVKGVLLSLAGGVQIVDITHEIPAQNVLLGAFVLNQVVDYFPQGTIHLAVVDPEVGTQRRVLAARYGGQTFVFPDNGIITLVDERLPLEAMASVRNSEYFLNRRVGVTFDGRDVMAPVAAALANGLELPKLGPPPETYKLLDLPEAQYDGQVLRGEIIYIDRYGNCLANISAAELVQRLPNLEAVAVTSGSLFLGGIRTAYAHVPEGEPLALLNSMNLLEIAVNSGNAAEKLKLHLGDPIQVSYSK